MFLMRLEINRQGWRKEPVIENQWESENGDDEFDSEYEIKLEEVEDVRTIFYLLCEELEKSNLVRFRVEGFGELPWPVDISVDLLTVLEQLADLLKFLDTYNGGTYCLNFYEQQTQRRLFFRRAGDMVQISCQPLVIELASTKKPSCGQYIEEEPIEKTFLKSMICSMIKTFILIATELCPTLTSHRCFQEWCSDKYIENCLQ